MSERKQMTRYCSCGAKVAGNGASKSIPELRAIASAATQGEWQSGADPCHFDAPEVRNEQWAIYVPTDADAAHIAAFSPATCLELLARLEAVTAARDELVSYALVESGPTMGDRERIHELAAIGKAGQ